jgi:dihydrodipicolinate synthase/N-acetylneuraminate lyase
MEVNKAPKGLIVDLITPLDDKGDIDNDGLGSLLKKVLPYADAVLLASPQMGEGSGLSLTLKTDLLKKAAAFIQGRIPIFFWISEDSAENTKKTLILLENLLKSYSYKGGVFWLDSPLYYHSNRDLYDHYQDLTLNTRYPFVLYNDPGLITMLERPLKRCNIRTSILKNLAEIGKIKALIFRGSLARANNYQKALNRRPDFRVYDGDEDRFLEHPSKSGVLSLGANIAPRIWSNVTKASMGMLGEDRKEWNYLHQIWEMGEVLKDLKKMYIPNPVWTIKRSLVDLNIIGFHACTSVTRPFFEKEDILAEFVSKHAIE